MPTLHRIKLLATNCATAPTSTATHSPIASPRVRRRRRRKTLRMLFDSLNQEPPEIAESAVRVRHNKLKDLLLSSSPPKPSTPPLADSKWRLQGDRQEQEGLLPAVPATGGRGFRFRSGSVLRRGGGAALCPVSSAFRHRLLRRAWRPMLLTIPEKKVRFAV